MTRGAKRRFPRAVGSRAQGPLRLGAVDAVTSSGGLHCRRTQRRGAGLGAKSRGDNSRALSFHGENSASPCVSRGRGSRQEQKQDGRSGACRPARRRGRAAGSGLGRGWVPLSLFAAPKLFNDAIQALSRVRGRLRQGECAAFSFFRFWPSLSFSHLKNVLEDVHVTVLHLSLLPGLAFFQSIWTP